MFWDERPCSAIREKLVCSRIRQLSARISKRLIFVEDHSGSALVCQKDQDVGVGPQGV